MTEVDVVGSLRRLSACSAEEFSFILPRKNDSNGISIFFHLRKLATIQTEFKTAFALYRKCLSLVNEETTNQYFVMTTVIPSVIIQIREMITHRLTRINRLRFPLLADIFVLFCSTSCRRLFRTFIRVKREPRSFNWNAGDCLIRGYTYKAARSMCNRVLELGQRIWITFDTALGSFLHLF